MKDNTIDKHWDCIIIGGGLAGGLLLEALSHYHPDARVLLLEKNSRLGGNHTWCFHASDVKKESAHWLERLVSKKWNSYEVHFPKYSRVLESGYSAIRSEDFHDKLMEKHSDAILLNKDIIKIEPQSVTIQDGTILKGNCVIDARGWANKPLGEFGYQKFLGLDLRLKEPHGLERVRLKDVRVPQSDGYRFMYLLPWSDHEILVEDTYYSHSSSLDHETIKEEIINYIKRQGWELDEILREESGALPLALRITRTPHTIIKLGASSGIYQPVTGYTFPQTLERVEALAQHPIINHRDWERILCRYDEKFFKEAGYLSLLNRMMFKASLPSKRYLMLERFYTLPQELIERFYKGELSFKDKLRILWGKPPVPVFKALKAIIE